MAFDVVLTVGPALPRTGLSLVRHQRPSPRTGAIPSRELAGGEPGPGEVLCLLSARCVETWGSPSGQLLHSGSPIEPISLNAADAAPCMRAERLRVLIHKGMTMAEHPSRRATVLLTALLLAFLLAGCSRTTRPAAGAGPTSGNVPAAVNDQPAGSVTAITTTAAPTSGGAPTATTAAPTSTPTATTAAPATGTPCSLGTVDSYDGLGIGVEHSNGLGGTFCHSTPLGTYTYALANAACASYTKDHGGRCRFENCGSFDDDAVQWEGGLLGRDSVTWAYEGDTAGHLRQDTNYSFECPKATDPFWV
jgi:hypothetical protein